MKAPAIAITLGYAAAVLLASFALAQTVPLVPPAAPVEAVSDKAAAVGMLPHQKHGIALDAKERNPFAERVVTEETPGAVVDSNSEESRIRAVLMAMRVSGVTRGGSGKMKAQLGGFVLEEGRELPQIIPNQTDVLKVTKVNEKSVVITWIDVEGTEQPRKHVIDLDMSPKVRTRLPSGGEEDGSNLAPVDPLAEEKRAMKQSLTAREDSPSPAE